ncbi:MAG: hypothetical protein RB191_14335 [Terriglobia bacterium]|nr:hypothetical protein [Terriglobia bacterium]
MPRFVYPFQNRHLARSSWESAIHGLQPDGFLLHSGQDGDGKWIAVFGADERGLLFGVGKLLRLIDFGRQQATLAAAPLHLASHPEYKLRGQQLGLPGEF